MQNIVYILGTTRSGTSALRNALDQTRYKGFGEGHLVGIFHKLLGDIRLLKATHPGALIEGVGIHDLNVDEIMKGIFLGYELCLKQKLRTDFILDKTPTIDPIRFSGELQKFHSSTNFLYCRRRHLDNIVSKQKKFPHVLFRDLCVEWAECCLEWDTASTKLDGGYYEFDFIELINETERIVKNISELLKLSDSEAQAMLKYLSSNRPEKSDLSSEFNSVRFSEINWSQEERDIFLEICFHVGTKYNYALETYFS